MKKFFSLLAAGALALSVTAGSNDNYIKKWGRLKLVGKQLSSESGEPVQLRGWSSFGWMSNWGDCHSDGHLDQMKAWNANIYRGAMYVAEGGYSQGNQQNYTNMTKHFIDYTAKIGIYYLCDWHVLTPGNPNDGVYNGASDYFREISSYVKSKGYKHVIYEICNEPNGCGWNEIKNYANKILPIIEQNDPGACVVVGTPQCDQDIHEAQQSPINGYNNLNLLYSFHYYSCSHQQFLSRLENAARAIPCFISEWGIANFDGGEGSREVGQNCFSSADQLMNIANGSSGQKISWCAWSFGEKNEQASSLMSCGSMELSKTGKKIVELLGGDGSVIIPKTGCYENSCQEVPGVVDLGKYDVDPDAPNENMGFGRVEGGSQYVGNGEGIIYHEENTTDDEVNNRSNCNGAFKWADVDYTFRQDECVDASGCYGITNGEGWHNLGYIEPGEWILLTVDVAEPGYYTIKALCNPTTYQYVGFGDVTHSRNALVNMKTDEDVDGIAFVSDVKKFNGEDWNSWGWVAPVSDLDEQDDADDVAILFKETGKHQLKISFMTGIEEDAAGDLGPLEFTLAKPYNGPGYEAGSSNVADVALNSSLIYPNPSNGEFAVAEAGELTITNMVGEVVYSANVAAYATINTGLKAGNYIATVKSADAVKVAKIVIK